MRYLRSIIPIGSIIAWSVNEIPTYGRGVWLECNGQSFDRNRFPQLYETLGRTTVPDYRDRFLVAVGSKYSVGQTGGEDTHKLTVDEMPSHTHTRGTMNIRGWVSGEGGVAFDAADGAFYDRGTRHGHRLQPSGFNKVDLTCSAGEGGCSISGSVSYDWQPGFPDDFAFEAARSWTGETSEEGGDRAHENRPSYIAVKWMIKAK